MADYDHGQLTQEQWDKLPKYARTHIIDMEQGWQRAARARDEARAELAKGPENSRVYVDGMHESPNRPLGHDPIVVFSLDGSNSPVQGAISIQFDAEGRNALEVSCPDPADTLVLISVSRNRFRLRLTGREGR